METFKNNNVIVWAPYRLITTIIPAYHAPRPQAQTQGLVLERSWITQICIPNIPTSPP